MTRARKSGQGHRLKRRDIEAARKAGMSLAGYLASLDEEPEEPDDDDDQGEDE